MILATNLIFPRVGVLSRMRWTGLKEEDFTRITDYEKSSFCKPFPKYFSEILSVLGLNPQECLMVGNDAEEGYCTSPKSGHGYLLDHRLPDFPKYLS